MPDDSLDIQDYLDATSDASKRTRTITIILVVASVLVLAGLLNSLQSHWMRLRLEALQNIHGEYTKSKLGPLPSLKDSPTEEEVTGFNKHMARYEQSHRDLITAIARAYVENSMVIRVPFFGFTFDVNDLGLLGGLGFLIILGCYRFCISRESDNLRLSFTEAKKLGKHQEFYNLLAMRQVFTVPQTKFIKRTRFLVITPKLICWLPLTVHLAVTLHDLWTAWIGKELGELRYQILISCELIIALSLLLLSISVTRRLIRIDRMWDHYHKRNLQMWRALLKKYHNKSLEQTAS